MTINQFSPVFHTTADGQIDIDALPIDWFIGAHRDISEATVKSPLQAIHEALGAHYVSLDDVQWILRYREVSAEYHILKNAAGMLDISVSTLIELSGDVATVALQHFFSNDILHAGDNSLRYGALVDSEGMVVDDCIVYKFNTRKLWLVANVVGLAGLPACITERWQSYTGRLECRDLGTERVKIQVQGPLSPQIMQAAFPALACKDLRSFECLTGPEDMVVGRCGYSGEDGFEIFVPLKQGPSLWEQLRQAGAVPYGIGAVEYCRVETGLLSLNDYIPGKSYPQEIGLGHFVKPSVAEHFDAYDKFLRATLRHQQWFVWFAPRTSYQGLNWNDAPRNGIALQTASGQSGTVTSLVYSPLYKCFVGLATFPVESVSAGECVIFRDWVAEVTTLDMARMEKKRREALLKSKNEGTAH